MRGWILRFFWCFCFWIQNRHTFKQDQVNFKFVTPVHIRRWGGEYARRMRWWICKDLVRFSWRINCFWCFCFWIQNRHTFKQDLVNFKFVSLVHRRWGGEYARLRFSWRMNCFWCFCFWIQNRHTFKQDLVNFKFVTPIHRRWGGEYTYFQTEDKMLLVDKFFLVFLFLNSKQIYFSIAPGKYQIRNSRTPQMKWWICKTTIPLADELFLVFLFLNLKQTYFSIAPGKFQIRNSHTLQMRWWICKATILLADELFLVFLFLNSK